MKIKYVRRTEITLIIKENNYYDLNKLIFDYSTNKIIYDNCRFEPKYEAWKFGVQFHVECSVDEYKDAIYGLARMNTPEPINLIFEAIKIWLEQNPELQITSTAQIINEVFQGKFEDLTQRKLEIQVGKVLTELNWVRVRRNTGNVWIK